MGDTTSTTCASSSGADHLEICFPGVVGHAAVQQRLSRAGERGRLHHGLIFVGAQGIGKRQVARGLACALCCKIAPYRGCGECPTCHRLLNGLHTDLVEIAPTGKSQIITVAQTEEVVLQCLRAPHEGGAHVVIIDGADRLNDAAANKLLKAVEEPSEGVYFVLVTTNLQAVISTLRSRCIAVEFPSLADDEVKEVLRRRLADMPGVQVDDSRQNLAIDLAQGSVGVALSLALDPNVDLCREVVAECIQAIRRGAPAVFSGQKHALWQSFKNLVIAQRDDDEPAPTQEAEVVVVKGKGRAKKASKKKTSKKKATGKTAETPAKQRLALLALTDLWLLHLRGMMRGSDGVPGLRTRNKPDARTMVTQIQVLQDVQARLRRNPNVRLVLEQALMDLSPRSPDLAK